MALPVKLLTHGIDTLKVNIKFTENDRSSNMQEVPEHLEAMFTTSHLTPVLAYIGAMNSLKKHLSPLIT